MEKTEDAGNQKDGFNLAIDNNDPFIVAREDDDFPKSFRMSLMN